MKYSTTLLSATLAGSAAAFPTIPEFQAQAKRAAANPSISGTDVPDAAQVANYFNAKEQYVSNTGKYAFVAPGKTDQRGPCPGLNGKCFEIS